MARPQPQPTKTKAHKASDELQVERLHKGYAQSMEITKVLADEKSQFQHIRIFDTVANGRVMTLDDIVQITSRDESAYADMLTHLPMLEHGKVERVMIVGGGDLSIADEALKHKNVKEVVLVDIDGRVIELCKKLFGEINAKAFKDKRMTIEVADAFEYLGRKSSKNRFDLIIADRPDPVGPGKALFGETFYDRVKGALKQGRLCHLPDRRAVLPALGDHRGAAGTDALLPPLRPLSDRGADLYRRLHGAVLGQQGRQAAGHAGRHQEGGGGLQEGQAEDRLLQSGHPCRGLRAAELDREAGALIGSRRALQVAVAIAGLVPVAAGAAGRVAIRSCWRWRAAARLTHAAYLSGLLLGIGLAFWSLIPTIERQSRSFQPADRHRGAGRAGAAGRWRLRLGAWGLPVDPAAGDGTGRHARCCGSGRGTARR